MKIQERRTYSNLHVSRVRKFERRHIPEIFKAIISQTDGLIDAISQVGIQAALNDVGRYLINPQMNTAIRELYIDSAPFFALQTSKEIKREANRKSARLGDNPEWIALLNSYFNRPEFLNEVVIATTQTTKEQIRRILNRAIEEGWSIDEISKVLGSPQLMESRAKLIARTEIAKAAFIGRDKAVEDSEFETQKEWITCQDDRVRPDHDAVDGKVIDSSDFFIVGGSRMQGPGDTSAPLQQYISCRCSLAIVPKRDKRGNLILR